MEEKKTNEEIPIWDSSNAQEALIEGLKHAIAEVALHMKGDINLQMAKDFLAEWSESGE